MNHGIEAASPNGANQIKTSSPLAEAAGRIQEQSGILTKIRNEVQDRLNQAIGAEPPGEQPTPVGTDGEMSDLGRLFMSLDALSDCTRRLDNELQRLGQLTG